MSQKLLIVGLGSIGRRHLSNLRQLRPDAKIAALRLHSAASIESSLENIDVQFRSVEEALAFKPDAAILAGPASLRLSLMHAFADAHIPMFLEKPIAASSTGLRELLHQCEAQNLPVMVGYNLRFLPSLKKVKELVDEGRIGRIMGVRAEVGQYLPDWRPAANYRETVSAKKALGGGALLELSHEIDYLYWLFGLPTAVTAVGGQYGELQIDVEDLVNLTLHYENPLRLINIQLDFLQRAPTRTCKFIGTNGTLIWNGLTDSIEMYCSTTASWSLPLPYISEPDRNQMYTDEISHFLACLEGKEQILIGAAQAFDVLSIVEAAKASIQNQSIVKVSGYANC